MKPTHPADHTMATDTLQPQRLPTQRGLQGAPTDKTARRTRRLSTALLAIVILAVANGPSSAQMPGFQAEWNGVRQAYAASLQAEGVVGSSLWFIHRGEVIAKEFYGLADTEHQRPVDENTIYHWASITKTFTAIAIMQLRDRGLLDLDDPIVDYVPELRAVHNPYGPMEAITLRHLLSHSAGFRTPTWPWGGDEPWHPHEPQQWDQLVAMMPYTKIHFEPGSRYSYSNPGIIFLGRVIESLTGDDYEVYVDKNILRPLEMYRSYFDHTPYHLLRYRSNNYYVTDGEVTPNGLDFDTGITVSNGGLNAPVGDMVKYLAFLTGDSTRQHVYDGILTRTSLEEMWEPIHEVSRNGSRTESMGLSYFIVDHGDLRVVGHTGGQKAFISFFYVHPGTRTAGIAAFNTLGIADEGTPRPNTRALLEELRTALFERIFPLFRDFDGQGSN